MLQCTHHETKALFKQFKQLKADDTQFGGEKKHLLDYKQLSLCVVYLHLSTSTIKSKSVLSFLMWSRLATVVIGTYWSLSICDMRYMSLARFSLQKENHLVTSYLKERNWG